MVKVQYLQMAGRLLFVEVLIRHNKGPACTITAFNGIEVHL